MDPRYGWGLEADVSPVPILLWRLAPAEGSRTEIAPDSVVDLMVDSVEKVHSVKAQDTVSKEVLDAAVGWKFIPSYKDGWPAPKPSLSSRMPKWS